MLIIEALSHVYGGGVRALDDVSLTVPKGMFGLLGPNGAGKSTLMRIVATLQTPTSGFVRFGDIDVLKDPDALRRTLGYLPQDFGVYPRVTALEMLDHLAVLKGLAEPKARKAVVEGLLRQVNLWEHRRRALAGYSGGMRQRFGIAQALIGEPQLIIVDEPTAGLDPEERNRFLNLLAEIGENVVVLLSTHIVADVADLCPAMAIICDGRIVRQGAPGELMASLAGRIWMKSVDKEELAEIRAHRQVISSRLFSGRTVVHVLSDDDPGAGFAPTPGGLDDVYFSTLAEMNAPARGGLSPTAMLGKVAIFEFRQIVRSPLFWAVAGIFFLLTFGFMSSDRIQIGDTANVHKNSPYATIQTHLIMAIFFMFAATAFVASSVLRDDETGFGPIVRAAPLSKFDYLYGRFAGAFAAALLAFAGVTAGLIVGSFVPGLDPEKLGAFRPDAYAYAFVVMAGPGLLFSSALFFALATTTRSMAWVFVAVIVLVVVYVISGIALGKPDIEPIAARWDPFGLFAFDISTRYWTANDRNTLLPALTGTLLFNRLFCLGLALGALALAFPLYRHDAPGGRARRKTPDDSADAAPASRPMAVVRPRYDRRAVLGQFIARTRFDMALVFRSPVFWIFLGLGLANAAGDLWTFTDDGRYGGALWPVTRTLIPALDGSFTLFVVIIAAYYSGELVWRDRDRRAHEIIEATPSPDWMFIVPKTAAVSLVLAATLMIGVAAAVLVQTFKGYYDYQLGEYLVWYLIPGVVDLTILSALAVFGQVIAPNKFAGWGVMMVYIIASFALPANGLEHNLYIFGGVNPVPLSDMNGQGKFWIGAWWDRLYWSAFALALLVAAYALWRRGATDSLAARLRVAPRRLAGWAGWLGLAAVVAAIGAGGFIYRNTNVLNDYRTGPGDDRWLADYEKALLPFQKVPQPDVVSVRLNVVIDPDGPSLETRGVYVLENHTGAPLREVHVRFDREVEVRALSVQGARAKTTYARFNYRIFTFDTPMTPGERRVLSFDTRLAERGFRNARRQTRDLTDVVDNGTFVNSFEITPVIGMDRSRLLTDRAKRRKYGLPAELHPAPLGDVASRAHSYIGHVGWVMSDITVTTAADQTPLAPGYEVSDVVHGRWRTARFVTDKPILQFFSIQSARYAVRSEDYKGVRLSVYYDPSHGANVDRMLRALRVSLDYYQANFSPYQFRQARIVEFPDYAQFAQSFAGTFPWSEGLGFIADYRDPTRIDLVTYIAAHEFAHQWWAHQLVGADQQGATVLSETLAQYSALRVMRRLYGPEHIRKFLKYELDAYLRSRGGEVAEELPLEKVEDQGYIHYRKGSLVMYRLADEIGEDAVNRALRSMLAQYAFKGAPYPTALDLVAALRAQAPADKQQLITDLFEKITLYDLKATDALARRRPDGRYDVALTVSVQKMYANGAGLEKPAPMRESVDVGVFTAKPGEADFGARSVLALDKRPIVSGVQTLRFVTAVKPKFAGIDPYNELIDRDSDDNIVAVR